ncbi:MAG: hypothetical protein ACRCXT_07605 [Paraclostridium sp.]
MDDGEYNSFDKSNFGNIMKYCGINVPDDILKENKELIPPSIIGEFVKYTKSRVPVIVREVINNMED